MLRPANQHKRKQHTKEKKKRLEKSIVTYPRHGPSYICYSQIYFTTVWIRRRMAIVNELAASKITEEIKILRSCPHSERRRNDKKGKVKTLGCRALAAAVCCSSSSDCMGIFNSLWRFAFTFNIFFSILSLSLLYSETMRACFTAPAKLVFTISAAGIWNILDSVDFSAGHGGNFSLCVFIQMTFNFSHNRCV